MGALRALHRRRYRVPPRDGRQPPHRRPGSRGGGRGDPPDPRFGRLGAGRGQRRGRAASPAGRTHAGGRTRPPVPTWSTPPRVAASFGWNYDRPRILASNTKLFTTAAALARYGVRGTLDTEVRGVGRLDDDGVWRGDLYLVGGGDPTFGSSRFARRSYRGGASVEALARELERAGILRVTGRIYGDESRFDSLRGGPDSGYRISPWVGPLSGLSYNRGLSTESGRGWQLNPPAFAAARLDAALERRDVAVGRRPRARRHARVRDPPGRGLFAADGPPGDHHEQAVRQLLRRDAASRRWRPRPAAAGQPVAERAWPRDSPAASAAGRRGSRTARASHARNRASPYRVGRLLLAMRDRDEFPEFFASLSVAGRDGTLRPRMRGGPARGRCRGKTGTIAGRLGRVRLLPRALRRHLRVLDPDERRQCVRRAGAAGSDAACDRWGALTTGL